MSYLLALNIPILLALAGYLYYRWLRREYIVTLGIFQTKLHNLTDFVDYLAIHYGAPEQSEIYMRVKMFIKSVRTISHYWFYLDAITGVGEIFIENAENQPSEVEKKQAFSDDLTRYVTQAKSALIKLQKTSERINRRLPYFAGNIVKIPFDLGKATDSSMRNPFLAKAIDNLTIYRERV